MVRRPNRPGIHGGKRTRQGSEFKLQLAEKQKIRISYGLSEKQMKNLVNEAFSKAKTIDISVPSYIINKLETRLDNVVYRMGFAPSRIVARQIVNHGHITVNGRGVTVPSYSLKMGDVVAVKESRKSSPLFRDLPNTLKGHNEPSWLLVDDAAVSGKVKTKPEGVELPFDINLIIDYYSR